MGLHTSPTARLCPQVLDHKEPHYVPWSYAFTKEARAKLIDHYGDTDLEKYMDISSLMRQYRGKLTFHGGLSTHRTLPRGSANDVRRETQNLHELGREGRYIFSPAHDVLKGVPLENMLAFIETVQAQPCVWLRGNMTRSLCFIRGSHTRLLSRKGLEPNPCNEG